MSPRAAASFMARHRTGLSVVGLCLVLSPVPLLFNNPWKLGILNLIAIHAIVALGLNLFVGYAGQISLGHAAFFGPSFRIEHGSRQDQKSNSSSNVPADRTVSRPRGI